MWLAVHEAPGTQPCAACCIMVPSCIVTGGAQYRTFACHLAYAGTTHLICPSAVLSMEACWPTIWSMGPWVELASCPGAVDTPAPPAGGSAGDATSRSQVPALRIEDPAVDPGRVPKLLVVLGLEVVWVRCGWVWAAARLLPGE